MWTCKTDKKTQREDAHLKKKKTEKIKISILKQKQKCADGALVPLRNCCKDCNEIITIIANDLGSRGNFLFQENRHMLAHDRRRNYPWGGVLGLIFAGYVPLASQHPYPIMVYSVTNYKPHICHPWANI